MAPKPPSRLPPRLPNRFGLLVLAATLLAFGLFSALVLPARGPWSGDTGIRVLQIDVLLRDNALSVPYLGQQVDPQNRWNPLSPRYFSWQGQRYFPKFSPAYAWLSAQVVRLFGWPLAALPALAGLALTLASIWWLLAVAGVARAWLAVPVIAFLSPVSFYANEVWEHSLATGLASLGAALAFTAGMRGNRWLALLAGLVLGMGLWLRAELYVFAPAVVLALLLSCWPLRQWIGAGLAALGFALGAVPLWLMQELIYGKPEGAQVAVDSPLVLRGNPASVIVLRMFRQWADTIPNLVTPRGPWPLWLLAIAAIMAGGVLLARGRRTYGTAIAAAGMIGLGVLALLNLGMRLAPVDLVAAMPIGVLIVLLIGSSLPDRQRFAVRFLVLASVLYLLAAMVTAPSSGGAQHGPRYLLSAYPLWAGLVVISLNTIEWRQNGTGAHRLVLVAVAVLTVASLATQAAGLRNLKSVKEQYARLGETTAELEPGPILTDEWWYPQVVPNALETRPVFLLSDPNTLPELADRLAANAMPVFTFATSLEDGPPPKLAAHSSSGRRIVPGETFKVPERSMYFQQFRIEQQGS